MERDNCLGKREVKVNVCIFHMKLKILKSLKIFLSHII